MAPPTETEIDSERQIPREEIKSRDESKAEQSQSLGDENESAAVICCTCPHATLCKKCGIPIATKEATKTAIDALIHDERPPLTNVFGNGPLLVSNVPESAKNSNAGVVLGIDEAGRGCVLGSMVYGCAYWSADVGDAIPKGFRDSKQMKESERDTLFEELKEHHDIGYALRSILPSEISRNMLRKSTDVYNLNEMSHDAAITLIHKIVHQGNVKVTKAFIDTVGNPNTYKRKLEREFPDIEFVVESKADANYAPCSAASVVAKVMRDRMLKNWKYSESCDLSREFGSGYPSDPKCKQWLESLHDPVFGYSNILRFSWATSKQKLTENPEAVPVVFRADLDDDDDELEQQKGMTQFLQKKRKRFSYFEKRNIRVKDSVVT
mmetsp:Transcript_1238/g.3149  ORF Transcript_1238/g.3149 Transcript_1238/m.3149 type:complete len:380 (+) Transcript_1238:254-1393(+)|eukprot:CAMPEP_0172360996 /NCGR_PEP_ID=MMETSP1060-20121228/4910_1 /TAXON_ID=37318 /ORGANISM="Pseudo-nitzschia pungens, Strain cf. cingulata" /LENGTH=379 /DNA_ID=CAMNT_0013083131 /DNA_START=152 /DNA_END=1291 /DNA_ORIENTATION=+